MVVAIIQKPNSRIVQFSSIRQSVRPSGPFIQFNCPYVCSMCLRVRPSNPFDPSVWSIWFVRLFGSSVQPSSLFGHPHGPSFQFVSFVSPFVRVVLPFGRLIQFVRLSVDPVCPSVLVFRP